MTTQFNSKNPALLVALGLGALLFVSKAKAGTLSRTPGSIVRGANGALYRVGANGRTLTPTGGNIGGNAGNVQGFGQPATINLGGLLSGLANAIKSATAPTSSAARAAAPAPAPAPSSKPSSSGGGGGGGGSKSSSSPKSSSPSSSSPTAAPTFDPKDFDPTDVYDANDARARQSPDPVGLPDGGAFDQYGDASPGVGDAGAFDQSGSGGAFDNVMPTNDGFAPGDYGAMDQFGSAGPDLPSSISDGESTFDTTDNTDNTADPGFDPGADYGGASS